MITIPKKSSRGREGAETALRARGLRLTRPRRVVLEVVRATESHPTAEWIHQMVRRRLPSARLPLEDPRVALAIGSTLIATSVLRRRLRTSALREVVVQALGAVPALVALSDRDLAAYHGVEHKAIGAYEQGNDDPASVPKEHDRCGSNLVAPMMLLSAGGTILLERLVESPGPMARAGVGLGGASLAVEMFAWSDRHHGAPLAEAFHTPGREIQRRLATKEPTPEQLEVGIAALAEILRAEGA